MAQKKEKTILLVIQRGGSTKEMYLHTFNTKKEVSAYMRNCTKAAYRTSPGIEIPIGIEQYSDKINEIVDAAMNLAMP